MRYIVDALLAFHLPRSRYQSQAAQIGRRGLGEEGEEDKRRRRKKEKIKNYAVGGRGAVGGNFFFSFPVDG